MNNFDTPDSRNQEPASGKIIVMRDWQLRRMIRQTVNETLACTNLDNLTADRAVSQGDEDMALIRRRVIIGYHDDGTEIIKRIQAKDENEANDKIVQAYVDSGRIWEFLDRREEKEAKQKTQTQFKAYAETWMKTFKLPKLKPKTYQSYVGYLHGLTLPDGGFARRRRTRARP